MPPPRARLSQGGISSRGFPGTRSARPRSSGGIPAEVAGVVVAPSVSDRRDGHVGVHEVLADRGQTPARTTAVMVSPVSEKARWIVRAETLWAAARSSMWIGPLRRLLVIQSSICARKAGKPDRGVTEPLSARMTPAVSVTSAPRVASTSQAIMAGSRLQTSSRTMSRTPTSGRSCSSTRQAGMFASQPAATSTARGKVSVRLLIRSGNGTARRGRSPASQTSQSLHDVALRVSSLTQRQHVFQGRAVPLRELEVADLSRTEALPSSRLWRCSTGGPPNVADRTLPAAPDPAASKSRTSISVAAVAVIGAFQATGWVRSV